jgi:RHS repeat-associated protein
MGGSFARTVSPQPLTATAYNSANQQTSFSAQTLTYDLNGNLIGDGANTYTWNARNQLVSTSGSSTANFQYDAFGRRTSKSINGTATSYLYDGANIVQEQTGGAATANMLNGGADEVFTRSDAAGGWNVLRDGLGSTLALTDATGTSQSEYSYDGFGGTTSTSQTSNNSSQYTGRENDGTGLYYYRARFYSPTLQRFISEDPIGLASGDANFYAYVRNNPITRTDPFGLDDADYSPVSGGPSPNPWYWSHNESADNESFEPLSGRGCDSCNSSSKPEPWALLSTTWAGGVNFGLDFQGYDPRSGNTTCFYVACQPNPCYKAHFHSLPWGQSCAPGMHVEYVRRKFLFIPLPCERLLETPLNMNPCPFLFK